MAKQLQLAEKLRALADQADRAKGENDFAELGIAIAELETWWQQQCFEGFAVLSACRISTQL